MVYTTRVEFHASAKRAIWIVAGMEYEDYFGLYRTGVLRLGCPLSFVIRHLLLKTASDEWQRTADKWGRRLFLLRRFRRRGALLHRAVGGFPGGKAAEQRARVFESLLLQQERRTGARVFGRSATVGDDALILRQICEIAGLQLAQRDIDGAFDVRCLVRVRASDIDDDRLLFREQLPGLFHADAGHLILGVLMRRMDRRGRVRRRRACRSRAGRMSGRVRSRAAGRRNRHAGGQRAGA